MSKISVRHKQRYVDHTRYRSEKTCIIHGPGNSSYECRVFNYFGSKYTKSRPTKELRKEPVFNKKVVIQQDNNDIIQHEIDYIILQEKEKLSMKYERHDNIYDEVD